MNERIWEIYGEALVGTADNGGDVLDPIKFAELIVLECANIAMREDHDPAECIKKHFGVEK